MRIFVSAGEVSGDVHAAYLVNELRRLDSCLTFFGVGSEHLAAAGFYIKIDITKRGTIGILEAIPNLLPIISVFNKVKKMLLLDKPDLAILIDSQGFNLPLAQFCRSQGIKTVYYIAPQEWLWGTDRGIKRVANSVDLIIAIFKKEYELYKQAGAEVVYFGHPLLDIVRPNMDKNSIRNRFSLSPENLVISVFPGSRSQELKNVFPVLLDAAKHIYRQLPTARFLIPAATESIYSIIEPTITLACLPRDAFIVVNQEAYNCLSVSDLAICTSGTINLEASILGIPNIMVYKLSHLTYFVGKYILKIDKKIKFFSMPNILLDEKILPELIMSEATPKNLAASALRILTDKSRRKTFERAFENLRAIIGPKGCLAKSAEIILASLQKY